MCIVPCTHWLQYLLLCAAALVTSNVIVTCLEQQMCKFPLALGLIHGTPQEPN